MLEFLKKGWWTILLAGVVGWCAKAISVRIVQEQPQNYWYSVSMGVLAILALILAVFLLTFCCYMLKKQNASYKKHEATKDYCSECEAKKSTTVDKQMIAPDSEWICMGCGAKNSGEKNFCTKCGKSK